MFKGYAKKEIKEKWWKRRPVGMCGKSTEEGYH